jgi:hypothetical protein
MQAPILHMEKWSDATFNWDRWRVLLMIDHFEAIKHELIFLWLILLIYSLYSSYIKVLVDAAVHSEQGQVIKCDFKPGLVERSQDVHQRGYISAGEMFNFRHQWKLRNFAVAIKIYRPFFKFDSIKEILEA